MLCDNKFFNFKIKHLRINLTKFLIFISQSDGIAF